MADNSAETEENDEVDRRSIYVGNVGHAWMRLIITG